MCEKTNCLDLAKSPLLLLPKNVSILQINSKLTDNAFVNIKMITKDIDGNDTTLFSGFCNVKIIDGYILQWQEYSTYASSSIVTTGAQEFPNDSQSSEWADPMLSQYTSIFSQFDENSSQEFSSPPKEPSSSHITVEHHNTFITQNIYNFNESYGDVELEEAYYETQTEESATEKTVSLRDAEALFDDQCETSALSQLMLTDEPSRKQRKTILFSGRDAQCGQTVHNIAVANPSFKCLESAATGKESINGEPPTSVLQSSTKKYQCDQCKQLFDHISSFKEHTMTNHKPALDTDFTGEPNYICNECGKTMRSRSKFQQHSLAHGDPELECSKCRKVFASKFTLRNHRKIHSRKHHCKFCVRSYNSFQELREHESKKHFVYSCEACTYSTRKYTELLEHQCVPESAQEQEEVSVQEEVAIEEALEFPDNIIVLPIEETDVIETSALFATMEQDMEADSVLAKIKNSKLFSKNIRTAGRGRRFNKICNVCFKDFDRIGDLKRHLIEHVIKCALAKSPVGSDGTLSILCGICQEQTFTKIEKYKAHLREHAKLTLYQCTFCDKSFSDSSNFSKHKKIHGTSYYFQCDLCQRKFHSKKMITQHMEYHNNNSPLYCNYCGKVYHFESTLNKHIRSTHVKQTSKFKCRFCQVYFRTLKNKWDHEWTVHNVRKCVVDCSVCDTKFRKYSELKRHCYDEHKIAIPPAKKFMRKSLTA